MPEAKAQVAFIENVFDSIHLSSIFIREHKEGVEPTVLKHMKKILQRVGLSQRRGAVEGRVNEICYRIANAIDVCNNAEQFTVKMVCPKCRVDAIFLNITTID